MTPEQETRLVELYEGRNWSTERIGQALGTSKGNVDWAVLRLGLDRPHLARRPLRPVPLERVVQERGDHVVVRFTQQDDAQLLALEAEGLNPTEIGRRLSPQRRPNSVRGRLLILARRDARAELQEQG